jgi:hypothetical protein
VTDPTVEFTDPYLGVLRPVPPRAPGVCRICHSGPSPGFAVCASCDRVRRQLSRSTEHVLPISLSVVGLQLHQLLWRYKNAPEGTSTTERTTVAARPSPAAPGCRAAACTLLRSGARSVTALVIGRVVDPDWNDACRAIWRWSRDRDFSFDRCCWCGTDG